MHNPGGLLFFYLTECHETKTMSWKRLKRCMIFHQRLCHPKLCAVSLLPLRSFPLFFSFLDRWQQLSLLPRVEITVFSKNIGVNVKLIHTSGLRVLFFFLIWSSLQISWRRLVTKYAGVKSDRTTCGAKILERRVIRNTWIRGKKTAVKYA